MPKIPNMIVVDDHLIFRQGLVAVIKVEDIANVIGEASDGLEQIRIHKVMIETILPGLHIDK
ncbi:MAG: hypothetical protein K0M40_16255 [Prolixibacteraceae bacterium]|nr:hypothetical protein [Prolixibacteraceae bacterium]